MQQHGFGVLVDEERLHDDVKAMEVCHDYELEEEFEYTLYQWELQLQNTSKNKNLLKSLILKLQELLISIPIELGNEQHV